MINIWYNKTEEKSGKTLNLVDQSEIKEDKESLINTIGGTWSKVIKRQQRKLKQAKGD